jgi:hypothetical protein
MVIAIRSTWAFVSYDQPFGFIGSSFISSLLPSSPSPHHFHSNISSNNYSNNSRSNHNSNNSNNSNELEQRHYQHRFSNTSYSDMKLMGIGSSSLGVGYVARPIRPHTSSMVSQPLPSPSLSLPLSRMTARFHSNRSMGLVTAYEHNDIGWFEKLAIADSLRSCSSTSSSAPSLLSSNEYPHATLHAHNEAVVSPSVGIHIKSSSDVCNVDEADDEFQPLPP